jgi:hypothetical protein
VREANAADGLRHPRTSGECSEYLQVVDSTAITLQLRSDSRAITQQLCSDCEAIGQRFNSDSTVIAQRLRIDWQRLRSDSAAIS